MPKYKKGDKVKLIGSQRSSNKKWLGKTGIITIDGGDLYEVTFGSTSILATGQELTKSDPGYDWAQEKI